MIGSDLAFAGLTGQAAAVRAGEVTAVELTELSLARIAALNPRLNAFVHVLAEEALDEAGRRDAQRAAGEDLPLLGVPMAIKDDTDVEGVVVTHGSRGVKRPIAADSEVVHRLRAAGAVIVGTTNMPELGLWPFTESQAHGITRNPWNTDRTTGGSSGGTAAAVASGMVAAGLGSDGGGSIRIPSACCGLFGLKSQRGRVSLAPHPDGWGLLGVTGPLTRSVRDAAIVFDAIHGNVAGDTYKLPAPRIGFVEAVDTPPKKLRIGFSTKPSIPLFPGELDAEQATALTQTAAALSELGHDVEEVKPPTRYALPSFVPEAWPAARDEIAAMDDPRAIERRTKQISAIGAALRPLRPLARRRTQRMIAKVDDFFTRYDLLLTPMLAEQPRPVGVLHGSQLPRVTLQTTPYIAYAAIWNLCGNPAASVPAGISAGGLPLAVQLVAGREDEPTILQVAAQLELARPWADRRPAVG